MTIPRFFERIPLPAILALVAGCGGSGALPAGSAASTCGASDGVPCATGEDGGAGGAGSEGGAASGAAGTDAGACTSSLAGFSPTPTSFALPAPRCQQSFHETASYARDTIGYTLADLTGDGHEEIVVYTDACDAAVGQTHWDVYGWTPTGFQPTPTAFALPAPRCQDHFQDLAQNLNVGIAYGLLDLTGEGHPEIVVYKDSCDGTVGQTHWDVYGWTPSGFQPTPTAFSIPAPRCQNGFRELGQDLNVGIAYGLVDLSGDGHADLVVYKDACDATVGRTHWDVYPWTSSGFQPTPTAFTVPAPRCQNEFRELSQNLNVGIAYGMVDLTSDGHSDLVVYKDSCDGTVGQTHWDVYPWTPGGFQPTPSAFTVPAPRCQDSFRELGQDLNVGVAYGLVSLAGGGPPGIVVYKDSCDATVGQTHWDVYGWTPTGFQPAPSAFAIPAPRCQDGFRELAQDLNTGIGYGLMSLTNACGPSLVVFKDSCAADVGTSHWDVYEQQ